MRVESRELDGRHAYKLLGTLRLRAVTTLSVLSVIDVYRAFITFKISEKEQRTKKGRKNMKKMKKKKKNKRKKKRRSEKKGKEKQISVSRNMSLQTSIIPSLPVQVQHTFTPCTGALYRT